jgi:hypothetical protein
LGWLNVTTEFDQHRYYGRKKHPLKHLEEDFDELDDEHSWEPKDHRLKRMEYVANFWEQLTALFRQTVIGGEVRIVARQQSPFADFTIVPGDVWQHFQVDDWFKGAASATGGERLFSIYMLPGEGPGSATDAEQAELKAEAKERRARRPRDQERAFIAFVEMTYPEGLDESMGNATLARAYADWFKGNPDAARQKYPATVHSKSVAKWRTNLPLKAEDE